MEIKFKFIDEKHIDIIINEKIVGHIQTPAGTMENEPNAVQICGFDKLYDYMGCGIFGDGKGNAKKDVQLWFNGDSQHDYKVREGILNEKYCSRCFHKKEDCKCNEFTADLKHEQIIKEEVIKDLK